MKQVLVALVCMLAFSLAGCSGSDGEENGGDDGSFVTPEQDEEGRYVITMRNFEFDPPQAEVPSGSTVVWINEAGSHNVVPEGHDQWEATPVSSATGVHLEFVAQEQGTYPYFCQPHQSLGMEASLRVV